jgi:geranylgeranyl diphosphate synthase type II
MRQGTERMKATDGGRSLAAVMDEERRRMCLLIDAGFPEGDAACDRGGMLRYVMTSGGKMLRPILCVLTFRSVGGRGETIYDFALLWEILHNFSLVHDDLPIMDDDAFRRGRPTLHTICGPKAAIVAGFDLLCRACELLVELVDRHSLPDPLSRRLVEIVTEAAGFDGMVCGQIMDLYWEGGTFDAEDVAGIHRRKTAGMIEGPVRMGAVLAGASGEKLESLRSFGLHLGLAYQIADDLLDRRSSFQEMGKATGRDRELKKATFLAIDGEGDSEDRLKREIRMARDGLSQSGAATEILAQVLSYALERGTGRKVANLNSIG